MGSGRGAPGPDKNSHTDEEPTALPPWGPHVEDFAEYLRLENLSPNTITGYLGSLNRLFRDLDLRDRSPRDISTAELRSYLAGLYKRGLAPSTIEKSVVAIKRFYGYLVDEGILDRDPAAGLPYPKVSRGLPKSLTPDEVRKLFSEMEGDGETIIRDRVFFELLYTCALRIGEAVRLRVSDVNWDDGRLQFMGKGRKERRVYLKPYVLAHLREYVDKRALEDYLFPGRSGHITPSGMRSRFRAHAREAGLPEHATPHTLRHSAAVHYLMGGAPISFVQDLLGHESLETTGIYTQLVDDVAREITLNTDNALYGGGGDDDRRMGEVEMDYAALQAGWALYISAVLPWTGL